MREFAVEQLLSRTDVDAAERRARGAGVAVEQLALEGTAIEFSNGELM